jgi:3-phenylpropionate/trans-cinnamate dioxygenase ferredoxin reductase subunit
MSERVVIVGAGHAAGQCVASLRQKKYTGDIVLIGEEPWLPYQRPPLSKKFLAGELDAERLHFKPQSFYEGVDVRLNTRVREIDCSRRKVTGAAGDQIDYGWLVLATGGRPRTMQVPGVGLDGIHYLRTIDDVNRIRHDMQKASRLVVVGAGYIGLEVAAVAAGLGLNVTVVEMEGRVMQRVVSPQLSEFYERVHRQHGVQLRLSERTSAFSGDSRLAGVVLESGEEIAADLAIIGIGIVPNTEIAAAAGLEVDNGIVVDEHCRSSDARIFAIGDCTMHPNALLNTRLRLESVHNALEQAKTAAANICGEAARYAQVPWFWSDQYDLKLQIAGISAGYDQTVLRGDPDSGSFSCLYLRDGVLIAIDAVNSPKDFMQSKALIAHHARVDTLLLANPEFQLKDLG